MKLVVALIGVVLLTSGAVLGATAVQQPTFDFLHELQTKFTTPLVKSAVDCETAVGPGVDWSGCDKTELFLQGPGDSLAGATLSGANFNAAYLNSVDMSGSAIDGLDLSAGVLFLVDFSNAAGVPTGDSAGFFIYTCPDGTAVANYHGEPSGACSWLPTEPTEPVEVPPAEPVEPPAEPVEAPPAEPVEAPPAEPVEAPPTDPVEAPTDPLEAPAEPVEAHCWEGISNGGFETTDSWNIQETTYSAVYNQEQVHSDAWALRTGISLPEDNISSFSMARQTVTIPGDVPAAILSFYIYPLSTEPSQLRIPLSEAEAVQASDSEIGDAQWLTIYDEAGQELQQLLSIRSDSRLWEYYEFDLTAYAGRTIELYFGAYNNGALGHTALYVDDVSLSSCPNDAPSQTTTPPPGSETVDLPVVLGDGKPPADTQAYP